MGATRAADQVRLELNVGKARVDSLGFSMTLMDGLRLAEGCGRLVM